MIRAMLEKEIGTVSDSEFETACEMATDDVFVNRYSWGKPTVLSEAMNILASCVDALRRATRIQPIQAKKKRRN